MGPTVDVSVRPREAAVAVGFVGELKSNLRPEAVTAVITPVVSFTNVTA